MRFPRLSTAVCLLPFLAVLCSPLPSSAQAPAPLSLEVSSVRPHIPEPNEPSNRRVLPGGRYAATNTTVRTLIRIAFGIDDKRMSGAPSWIDNEAFDINAITAGHVEIQTPEQLQHLTLTLLEERFQFKFHRGTAEGPVFLLELEKPGKLGPALKPSAPETKAGMSVNRNAGKITMRVMQTPMDAIASALSRQLGRPVENRTGLKSNFDFSIQWAADETAESADPGLFTVMKEQLGIKVRPAKGTFETIIIDQISHPTEN